MIAVTQKGSTELWQIAEVPLPDRIVAAQISADGGLAALRTTRRNAQNALDDILLSWNLATARAGSPMNLFPIKRILGVMPSLRLAVGTCDPGLLCIVQFGNDGTTKLIRKSKRTIHYPSSLIFSGDGRFVAGSFSTNTYRSGIGKIGASTRDTNTIVWDIKDQEAEPVIISDGSVPLNAMVLGFSPESDRCIFRKPPPSKDVPGQSKLWDLKKKSFGVIPKPFQLDPLTIAFSAGGHLPATSQLLSSGPAGAKVISGSSVNVAAEQNYRINIWHWPNGNEPFRTFVVDTEVRKMSFSPDNRFLITAGSEPFIRVFDINAGKENGRVALPQSSPPLAMTFVNRDRRILAFDQYYVTNSPWRPEDLMEEACVRIGRPLTAKEWNKYLPTEKGKYFPTCKAYLPSH